MATIEKIKPEDIPGWHNNGSSFQQAWRDVAKTLAESPAGTAIRIPLVELTGSNVRGSNLLGLLRSMMHKFKPQFQIGTAENEALVIRCDNEYAYFIRQMLADPSQKRTFPKRGDKRMDSVAARFPQ